MSNTDEKICCICGIKFTGWGNDPWPVDTRDGVECCEVCNAIHVVPARLANMYRKEKENEK